MLIWRNLTCDRLRDGNGGDGRPWCLIVDYDKVAEKGVDMRDVDLRILISGCADLVRFRRLNDNVGLGWKRRLTVLTVDICRR